MKVRELMTKRVQSCRPSTDLAAAAMIMWQNDCGVAPVVSEDGRKVLGVITDRDICMAVATRHRRPEELTVGEVFTGRLFKVEPDDDIDVALETMRSQKVRRLPVVGRDGTLAGVLSISDLVLKADSAGRRGDGGLSGDDVLDVLKVICEAPAKVKAVPEREPVHA